MAVRGTGGQEDDEHVPSAPKPVKVCRRPGKPRYARRPIAEGTARTAALDGHALERADTVPPTLFFTRP
jgi:hypothetical protein